MRSKCRAGIESQTWHRDGSSIVAPAWSRERSGGHTGEVSIGKTERSSRSGTSRATEARAWKLTLSYDGSDFYGWQVQPGLPTVQGTLQQVVKAVLGESVLPQGSGRTDTGVHADGQVVSLALKAAIPPERLLRALNRKLPGAVRVLSAEPMPDDFHARANVAWKQYTYRIFPRRCAGLAGEQICPPLLARSVWDCRWPLELDRMQAAAADVVGTFDFSSFAARDPDTSDRRAEENTAEPRSKVRTIFASTWTEEGGLLVYHVTGTGFLHHMVRNLVGTFVEIGSGRRSACLPAILAARTRSAAGATAPPQGLALTRVVYRGETDAGRFLPAPTGAGE